MITVQGYTNNEIQGYLIYITGFNNETGLKLTNVTVSTTFRKFRPEIKAKLIPRGGGKKDELKDLSSDTGCVSGNDVSVTRFGGDAGCDKHANGTIFE